MTVTIYHNPRCSKSRAALELIEKKGGPVNVIEYLNTDLSKQELESIISLLKLTDVRDIMRTSDPRYDELKLADHSVDKSTLINAIVENPVLLERPIVLANDKAALGRPLENVVKIL